jgi:tetratricopeptide (TPR) repeat protein
MRIQTFPGQIAVSIGIVSACFLANCISAGTQQPQVNAGQATVEAQRQIQLRTADSEFPLTSVRGSAGDVNPGVDVRTLSGTSESTAFRIQNDLVSLDKMRKVYQANGDRRREATVLMQIGSYYIALGQMQKAIDEDKEALPIWKGLKDAVGEASTLAHIGDVYRLWGFPDRAIHSYEASLPHYELTSDVASRAAVMNNIALSYMALGKRKKTLEYLNHALAIYQLLKDEPGEAATLCNLGSAYNSWHDGKRALEFLSRALPLMQAHGNRVYEATILNDMGFAYATLNDRENALARYQQARMIFSELQDSERESAVVKNMDRLGSVAATYTAHR